MIKPQCPNCKAALDGWVNKEGLTPPSKGDMTVCAYCDCILRFGDGVEMHRVEVGELERLEPGIRIGLRASQATCRAARHKREVGYAQDLAERNQIVLKSMHRMHEWMDPIIKRGSRERNASCRLGCAHCCHLLAMIGVPDGLVLAERVLGREDWESWLPRLRAAVIATDYDGITHENYFDKQIPCIFLAADNSCQVYSARPTQCRTHVALTPKEICEFSPGETRIGTFLDFGAIEREVFRYGAKTANGAPIVGSIPAMTLLGMGLLTMEVDKARFDKISAASDGLLNPAAWIEKHGAFFVEARRGAVTTASGDDAV